MPKTNAPIMNNINSAVENDPSHVETGSGLGGAMFPRLMFSCTVSL